MLRKVSILAPYVFDRSSIILPFDGQYFRLNHLSFNVKTRILEFLSLLHMNCHRTVIGLPLCFTLICTKHNHRLLSVSPIMLHDGDDYTILLCIRTHTHNIQQHLPLLTSAASLHITSQRIVSFCVNNKYPCVQRTWIYMKFFFFVILSLMMS